MKLFQNIPNSLITHTLKWLLTEFLSLSVLFVVFLRDIVASWMQDDQARYWLSNTVLILLAIILVLLSYIFILLYKHKLNKAFGLLWDKELNAYCPTCRTLCSYSHEFQSSCGSFYCPKCKFEHFPIHSSGHRLSYKGIQDIVKNNLPK